MSSVTKTDVVIVGAGLTGLTAAKTLAENNVNVIVLEAKDRVGGRLYTVKPSSSPYADLGGQYLGPFDNHTMELCKKLGVEIYTPPPVRNHLALYTKGTTTPYKHNFPIWNPIIKMDLINFFRELKLSSSRVSANAPWDTSESERWDTMTVKQWLDEICWTKTVKQIAAKLVKVTFCAEPEDISLLYLLWFRKMIGILFFDNFVCVPPTLEIEGARIVGGAQKICDKISENINVILKSPVQQINYMQDSVTVTTDNGEVFEAEHVICAVSLPMVHHITFSPTLPSGLSEAAKRIPMGLSIKTITYYHNAFWIDEGFSGNCLVVGEDEFVDVIVDDTKPDGSSPALVCLFSAENVTKVMKLSKIERERMICGLYAKIFKAEEAKKPLEYIECNWVSESYINGGFAFYCPTGVITNCVRHLKQSYGPIHFAASDTFSLLGSVAIEIAVNAGLTVARKILYAKGKVDEDVDAGVIQPDTFAPPPLTWQEKYVPSVGNLVKGVVKFGIVASCVGAVVYSKVYKKL